MGLEERRANWKAEVNGSFINPPSQWPSDIWRGLPDTQSMCLSRQAIPSRGRGCRRQLLC
jgi:hypothetical protein